MLDFRKRAQEAYDFIISRNFIHDVSTELGGRWNYLFCLFVKNMFRMNNDQHIVCGYFVFHLSFYGTHMYKNNIKI